MNRKKRTWAGCLALAMTLALTACGGTVPEAPDTPDSGITVSRMGGWDSVEDYVESVMLAEAEVTYWTYNATRDNTEDQVTSPVTDRKLEYLEKGGELSGLAPEGTLEEWSFNYLVKFDTDPETVFLAGGQSYDDEGYFALDGSHEMVALRYPDGSYDVLYDECAWDHFDFFNYCETMPEVLHDWYVKEYGLDQPLYVVDWADQIEYNDGQDHGNFPLHRFDGDGFSIYVPVSAWVIQEPSKNHWEWYSAYGSGSTIVVNYFTQSVEDDYVTAQKQGFTPLDDTKQVWTRRQDGINERYWFYPAADGNGSWRVWTLWTDEGVSDYPYIFIEPQTMYLMAEHFLVTAPEPDRTATFQDADTDWSIRVEDGWSRSGEEWVWQPESGSGSLLQVEYRDSLDAELTALMSEGYSVTDTVQGHRCVLSGDTDLTVAYLYPASGDACYRVDIRWSRANSNQTTAEARALQRMAESFFLTSSAPRYTFGKVLWDAYQQGLLPDGTELEWNGSEGAAYNDFALYDVDGDGQEELLLYWGNASMAGMRLDVFGYRDGAVHTELTSFPMTTFYSNGTAIVDWSHNQGLAGNTDFWPYDLYTYDAKTDSYTLVGSVDAWSADYPATSDEFPADIDADGDGMVYFLLPVGWEGNYDTAYLVDGPEHEAWRNRYLDGGSPLIVPTQKLAEASIAALGCPKPIVPAARPVG